MCTSTDPDQEAVPSVPSAAPLFWVSFWDLDPLFWVVVQTEDPLRESHIPGRNVDKLTYSSSRLYVIVIDDCLPGVTMYEIIYKQNNA
jgi:hypothetical protein